MAAPSHTVAVTITASTVHTGNQMVSVSVDGSGDIDHMVETFRAALVAAGFTCATAATLDYSADAEFVAGLTD